MAYQDNLGSIHVKTVSRFPTPIHVKTVGVDEVRYDRLTGAEKPCEKIRVTGVINRTKRTKDYLRTVNTQYGPISAVDPKFNSSSLTTLSHTVVEEELDFVGRQKVTKTTKYEPVGKILPSKYPGSLGLSASEYIVETKYFEKQKDNSNVTPDGCNDPDEGKLKKTETIVYRPFGAALAEFVAANPKTFFVGLLLLTASRRDTTTYEYKVIKATQDSEATIIPKISSLTKLNAGAILPDENWASASTSFFVADLVTAESKYQVWEELRPEEWSYTESIDRNLATAFPEVVNPPQSGDKKVSVSVRTKLLLINVSRKTITSNSGQATPPAPERFPPSYSIKQEQVKVEVNIPGSFGSQFSPREREFSIDAGLATSKAQAQRIGEIEGHVLWGRYKGQSIALDLSNELFNCSPLAGSVWNEPSGKRHLFMIDGFSVAFANNRFAAQFDGIWSGHIGGKTITVTPDGRIENIPVVITPGEPIPPGTVSPPYMVIDEVEIGSGFGFDSQHFPYSIELVVYNVDLGCGSGFAVLTPEDFSAVNVTRGGGFGALMPKDFSNLKFETSFKTEIYKRKETPVLIGLGSGVEILNGLRNEKRVFLCTGFGFDLSPTLRISHGNYFNIRDFSGIDPESDTVSLGCGKGFDIQNTPNSGVEICYGNYFNIRDFSGIDPESDTVSLGCGKDFDIQNAPNSGIEIRYGNYFNINDSTGVGLESDPIGLGCGKGFDIQNAPNSGIEILYGNYFSIPDFSGIDPESDTINLSSG